jgi:hypothetical protein
MLDEAKDGLRLVVEAISSGTSGCVLWKDEDLIRRVRADRELDGLEPNAIIDLMTEASKSGNAIVKQKREARQYWKDRNEFVYDVLFKVSGFSKDLYVELVLKDPCDEDCPEVVIVSAHLTSF